MKVTVSTHIFLSNEYKLSAIQFTQKLKEVLKIQQFDLQRFLLNVTKPPLRWPFKVGVMVIIV